MVDTATQPTSLRERIDLLGRDLSDSIQGLLRSFPRPITSAAELTKLTGLNRNSASRIIMAIAKRDALATMLALPGPEALRKLVAGARKGDAGKAEIASLSGVIDRYEHMVSIEFAGRPALEAAIALWLPHARARVEAANRHLVFRGMAALRGISVDTALQTVVVMPSSTHEGGADLMVVMGSLGLRRLIPGAPIRLVAVHAHVEASRYETVDGAVMRRLPVDGMLPEYSSQPFPTMHEETTSNNTQYAINDEELGLGKGLDLMYAQVGLNQAKLRPEPGRNRFGHSLTIVRPTRELVLDTFLHKDVWPGISPTCMVYDTASFGAAKAGDPAREIDIVPQELKFTELGTGLGSLATPSVPNYPGMLRDLFQRRGYDPSSVRGYRLTVTYPIYAGQHAMLFRGPYTDRE